MGASRRRKILIFGAGNICLSFVGPIFDQAGYRDIFADTARHILQRLCDYNGYTLRLLSPDGGETRFTIHGNETVDATDEDALAQLLTDPTRLSAGLPRWTTREPIDRKVLSYRL